MAILLSSATAVVLVITCLCAFGVRRHDRVAKTTPERALIDLLLTAMAERDPELGAHSSQVADAASIAAQRLGLSRECIAQVRLAAELHDIGKLAVPERILCKPGPLDSAEWEIMRAHTEIGACMLNALPAMAPVGALVLSSHERHDGAGYPCGLRGDQIPLGSRIIAACDAFDAMTTQRVYNRPVSPVEALARLRRASGSQFDPLVVGAVCTALQEVLQLPVLRHSECATSESPAPSLQPVAPGTLFA